MDFIMNVSPEKILIIKLSAMGDVIMSLPALRALKDKYPKADIDWLVEAPTAGLLLGHPSLNRVIISPRQQVLAALKKGHLRTATKLFFKFYKELRAVKYDVVMDLQGLLKSGITMGLSRGLRKVGFDRGRELSHWFLNEKLPPYDPERHAALRYLDVAIHLGADCPKFYAGSNPGPYYTPSVDGEKEATQFLANSNEKFIVLNPGTRRASKCWPIPHWQKLAELITTQTDMGLVITGSQGEAQSGEEVASISPRILNLCGRTTLPGLAAILARSQAMVTGDTGPMHLAAAVGAGGLALFGPTRPGRTGPFGGHFTIVTPPRECLGCLKKQCEFVCLDTLEPEVIWEQLQKYLQL